MKKLALLVAVAGIVGLSSCSKDTVCTGNVNGKSTKVTITDNDVTTCIDNDCETETFSQAKIESKEDAIKAVENVGLTCK